MTLASSQAWKAARCFGPQNSCVRVDDVATWALQLRSHPKVARMRLTLCFRGGGNAVLVLALVVVAAWCGTAAAQEDPIRSISRPAAQECRRFRTANHTEVLAAQIGEQIPGASQPGKVRPQAAGRVPLSGRCPAGCGGGDVVHKCRLPRRGRWPDRPIAKACHGRQRPSGVTGCFSPAIAQMKGLPPVTATVVPDV
jgi:hypothetical protein